MFVLVIGNCELMTDIDEGFGLLLGVPGKLFLITFTAFWTFSVFLGVKGLLIINFFSVCVLLPFQYVLVFEY